MVLIKSITKNKRFQVDYLLCFRPIRINVTRPGSSTTVNPLSLEGDFLWLKSTNLLDLSICSQFEKKTEYNRVGSQWFVDLLPNQAYTASSAAQPHPCLGRKFENH